MLPIMCRNSAVTNILFEDQLSNLKIGEENLEMYNFFQALYFTQLHYFVPECNTDFSHCLTIIIFIVVIIHLLSRKNGLYYILCFKKKIISFFPEKGKIPLVKYIDVYRKTGFKSLLKSIIISYFEENNSNSMRKDIVSTSDIDINCTDSEGKATLHHYAETNNILLGEYLLNKGVDVDVKTKERNIPGKTSLYISAKKGHKDFVKLLLKWNANVNERNEFQNETALYKCVEHGFDEVAEILLNAGADVNLTDSVGRNALHIAAGKGNEKLVKLLLERGANVNSSDDYGRTALHHCTGKTASNIIVMLLEAGALIDITDRYGKTALHCAILNGQPEYSAVYTLNPINLTYLQQCQQFKNDVAINTLLKANFSSNIRDNEGRTALHYAAMYWDTEIVLKLIKLTDCINEKDTFGKTALHYSSGIGQTEVVKALLEAGASVDVIDQYGKSPLHCSVDGNAVDVIQLLIQNGADVNIVDNSGKTALDVAKEWGLDEAAEVLTQHGAKSSIEARGEMNAVLDSFTEYNAVTTYIKPTAGTTTFVASYEISPNTATPTVTNACTTSPVASVETTTSNNNSPSMDTTPTASKNTPNASDDTTQCTDTAPSMDTTPTASSTTPHASVETTQHTDIALTVKTQEEINVNSVDILEESYIENVEDNKRTQTKSVTQLDDDFPLLDVKNVIKKEIANISKSEKTRSNGKTVMKVSIHYNPKIVQHCNELNVENVKYLAMDSNQKIFIGKSRGACDRAAIDSSVIT